MVVSERLSASGTLPYSPTYSCATCSLHLLGGLILDMFCSLPCQARFGARYGPRTAKHVSCTFFDLFDTAVTYYLLAYSLVQCRRVRMQGIIVLCVFRQRELSWTPWRADVCRGRWMMSSKNIIRSIEATRSRRRNPEPPKNITVGPSFYLRAQLHMQVIFCAEMGRQFVLNTLAVPGEAAVWSKGCRPGVSASFGLRSVFCNCNPPG